MRKYRTYDGLFISIGDIWEVKKWNGRTSGPTIYNTLIVLVLAVGEHYSKPVFSCIDINTYKRHKIFFDGVRSDYKRIVSLSDEDVL